MHSVTVLWPSGLVRLSWLPGTTCALPVSGVHAFCFTEGKALLCDIRGRGLSIPGGHPRPGENLLDTIKREIREEACAEVDRAVLAGYLVVDHSIDVSYVGPYPTIAALAVFA